MLALLAATALLPGTAWADLPLARAALEASEHDPGITALRQEIARRGIDIEAARDEGRPKFSLSAETATTGSDGAGVVLTVSQLLYDWGRVEAMVASATQDRVIAVAELKNGIERLTRDVSDYFIDVKGYDEKIALTQEYLAFARRIADHAQARARAGRSDKGEVARAELEVIRSEEQLLQLRGERKLAMEQLAFLLGRDPGPILAAPELDFLGRFRAEKEIREAVQLSPDYVIASAELAQAEAEIAMAKAARLPSIRLQGQFRSDLERGRNRGAVGLAAGVDLGMGGVSGRQLQAAKLQAEAARSNLAAVERNILNAVQTAQSRIAVIRANEQSQKQQLSQADEVLANYEAQFVAGQRELLDLLTTGRDQYDARIAYVDTRLKRQRIEYDAAHDLGVLGTLILAK